MFVRAENVCMRWKDVIRRLVKSGRLRKAVHVIRGLKTVESFNESFSIKDTKVHTFRAGSALAAAAERIHQTNMEIIRLKHPGSLRKYRVIQ